VTLTAPTAEGTFTVTAECLTSGVSESSEITVDAGDDDDGDDGDDGSGTLPETGSSTGTIAQVGAVLLVSGLGLIAVTRLRRRRPIGI
jgi:LPXTG-motif cell wall-anchored protein